MRSLESNSLQYHWFRELAQQGDNTSEEYQSYCKLHFGTVIRGSEDPEFAEFIDSVLSPLDYEAQLKLMSLINISSTFNRDQMTQYLSEIRFHFEREGFILTNGEDLRCITG